MKYGQTFQAQSVPQWAPYNIDYNELKNVIKVHTTKDQAQAIAIPGQTDTPLARFEALFFDELSSQHDRVDLFVQSKAGEISRRLDFLEATVLRLLARCIHSSGRPMSQKRLEKFGRYDNQISRCGDDINSLQRFVDAQRMAFHKILKKYKKWSGSRLLGERFNREVLGGPKSFTRRDFKPLLQQYNNLLQNLRLSWPSTPGLTTSPRLSRPSAQLPVQQERQSYWNEYDDGSEVENEPYTIYVNPDAESPVPGARTIAHLLSLSKAPIEKVRTWLGPHGSLGERRPLMANAGYFIEQTETDVDDTSSGDFPAGYDAHYATFPSVDYQTSSRARERLLFRSTIASFAASLVLLLIASTLVATGRHKLRMEVNAGAIVGIVSSLFFATLGFGTMLYRTDQLSWLHRTFVVGTFSVACILNGVLLVIVLGESGL